MPGFPYRIVVLWSPEDNSFVGRVPAFPGLAVHGDTADDAATEARMVVEAMLEVLRIGGEMPPPSDLP